MGEDNNDTLKNIILFLVYAPTTILALVLVYMISTSIMKWIETGKTPEMIEYIMFIMKQIILFIAKPIQKILKLLNYLIPIPWRENGNWTLYGGEAWSSSMRFATTMIIVVLLYLITSIIFIMDGTPASLKIYSDTITYSLLIGAIILSILSFILFAGKSSGKLITKGMIHDGNWVFTESKPYLLKTILSGLVIGVLGLISHFFLKESLTSINIMYFTMIMATIGLMFYVYIKLKDNKIFERFLKNNVIISLLYKIIFIIPSIFYKASQYLYNQLKDTPQVVYFTLLVEIVIITLYIIIPMIKNHLYVIMPTKDEKLFAIDEKLSILNQEIRTLKTRNQKLKNYKPQNGYILNEEIWDKLKKKNYDGEKLEHLLIQYGYKNMKECNDHYDNDECMKPLNDMIEYIKVNLPNISINDARINTLRLQIKDINDNKNKMTNTNEAIVIQNKPVPIDNYIVPENNKLIPNTDDFKYNYTLSLWFFITHRSGEHGYKYNKYSTILDYNMKPKISFNSNLGKVKIEMNSGGDGENISVSQYITDAHLQKWNNLVINYDGGYVDIFINGKLKKSLKNIIPTMSYDAISIGENNGISGGVCNVVYYPLRISHDRIMLNYNLLKNNNPPTI